MMDFWGETKVNKINYRKIIIILLIIIVLAIFIATIIIYINNKEARNWIDKNILQKEKTQNNLPSIEIQDIENFNIYAFNKNIGLLSNNKFDIYDNSGRKENTVNVEITKPIFNSNDKYLVIAEENGQKLYLISDKEILWERDIDGNISQVEVNKNGYIAVTIVDTVYKTVVAVYDNHGERLFNTYLSTTRVVKTSISEDNKYLAIAEIDTSGTMIQSNIRILSIEDGKNNSEDSIKKVYNGEKGDLITNIKYQDKDKLLCMYTNKITLIKPDETTEVIQEYKNRNIAFISIDLSNASIIVEEKSSGIFTADSVVNIINSDNKSTILYTAESVTKEIYTNNNIIALNLGSEVEFINTNGWLIKRYKAEQEITHIVISNSIAGIIYRDKIEIINL